MKVVHLNRRQSTEALKQNYPNFSGLFVIQGSLGGFILMKNLEYHNPYGPSDINIKTRIYYDLDGHHIVSIEKTSSKVEVDDYLKRIYPEMDLHTSGPAE